MFCDNYPITLIATPILAPNLMASRHRQPCGKTSSLLVNKSPDMVIVPRRAVHVQGPFVPSNQWGESLPVIRYTLTTYMLKFRGNIELCLHFPQHWDGTDPRMFSSWKTRNRLSYAGNAISPDHVTDNGIMAIKFDTTFHYLSSNILYTAKFVLQNPRFKQNHMNTTIIYT